MATVLENYLALRSQIEVCMTQMPANADMVWWYGEILYRVSVLETCQMFCKAAPVTQEAKMLQGHYRMLDAYVQSIAYDRRYGPDRGANTDKEREAAQTNLSRVIEDYRKRFSSFAPNTPDSYRNDIGRVVMTLIPAWLAFRDTFVPIKKAREAMNNNG